MNKNGEAKKKSLTAPADHVSIFALLDAGDHRGMATLYDRYSGMIYSVGLRVLRDPAAAEGVLQDVLMLVWRTPQQFAKPDTNLGIQLALVARNRAVSILRREHREGFGEDMPFTSSVNLTDEAERRRLREHASRVLRQLPREQSKVLGMAFFDGVAPTEIAEMTGEAVVSVKERIRTALVEIRKAVLP